MTGTDLACHRLHIVCPSRRGTTQKEEATQKKKIGC